LKIKGIYLLYRILQAFGLPLVLLYFLWRGFRDSGYWRSLPERLGFLPHSFRQTGPGAIWLHAVSVGEVLSSAEFLRRLRSEFPRTRIFVSTSTLAGRAVASEKLAASTNGIFYAPADYVWAVRRVLRTLQPSVVVIAETEIWPNLFREAKRTGAGLAIVNGRISDRAFPRYRRLSWFFRAVLPAADSIQVQTDAIGARFLAFGASPAQVQTAGNFKYDFEARPATADSPVVALVARLGPARVWIAASTMPPSSSDDVDEDDAVLDAFRTLAELHPDLLLILVPRKPERFDLAAQKLSAAGIRFLRRSELTGSATVTLPAALLLDSVGELGGLFFLADVVFLGGTLARRGGHNILEPAFFSKPVMIGPHMENFQAIAEEFRRAGACVEIAQSSELAGAVDRLLDCGEIAAETGRRALACAQARGGATASAVALARDLYLAHVPQYRPAQPWFSLRWALSRIWLTGARLGEKRGRARQRQLPIPVISVGNITLGGTGKTPCVLRLAEALKQSGYRPGILTRGYGRSSPDKQLILAPRATMPTERTGDEPQLFLRSGLAPVGIGADRFETGRLLAQTYGADVLVLDDGFQHHRLARSLDIVLIDALNPFGGESVFPLGRLREPLQALARADLILITRSDFTDLAPAIERRLRRWNSQAPVFQARLEPRAWVAHATGERHPLPGRPFRRPAAFCGLGNPQSFRRTLDQQGIHLTDWLEFTDHHHYRARELRYLRHHAAERGADALVTTEKDVANLCQGADALLIPLPLYWLEVTLVIDREGEFLKEVERHLTGF
jgi:tetraacyldisaccharide 4'-kinase